MINGLGVVGWGVGGIEAEACMLGQPISMLLPASGRIQADRPAAPKAPPRPIWCSPSRRCCARKAWSASSSSSTATAWPRCSLADRATIANMAPEYGATIGFFPIDQQTLDYLRLTNRSAGADRAGGSLREGAGPVPHRRTRPIPCIPTRSSWISSTVVPSLAGPKRPQDRINLPDVKKNFLDDSERRAARPPRSRPTARSRPFRTAAW